MLRKCACLQLETAEMQSVDWNDLRYFLAVHRKGSHKAAGRLLGVAPTTVSRRLDALQEAVRAVLFVRTPDRLLTTPASSSTGTVSEAANAVDTPRLPIPSSARAVRRAASLMKLSRSD